jgi:hypothetical protein
VRWHSRPRSFLRLFTRTHRTRRNECLLVSSILSSCRAGETVICLSDNAQGALAAPRIPVNRYVVAGELIHT